MPALLSGLEPAARIVVATLFNNLWEAAVLAAVVAIVLRVLPNVNATTRYAAWCVALVGSLLLPLATALPQIAVQPQGAVVRQTHPDEQQTRHGEIKPGAPAAVSSTHRAAAPAGTAAPSSSFRLPERLHFSLPQYVALAIFAVWCLAALLLLVRLAINLWKLERLKSDALPLPVEYRERLERWARADKGEREVRLCTCEAIEVPVAVGLFDSMILIPKHLLDTLSQSEIDQIILHELAHLRRADDWTNGFQRFIQALFFFNPAVLYIAQQLDLEREVACDDWVVDQTKEVRPYATCLTKMAEATAWPHRPLAAPGVFVTRRGLSVRVERLLRAGRNIRTSVSFGPTGAIVASLIVLFFVLQTVAPSFAFTMNGQSAQHAVTVAAVTVAKEKTPPQKAVVKVKATPKPHVKYVTVPSVNVDVPAQHIDIPAQHIHMHAQRIPIMTPSFPPGFAKHMAQISKNAVDVSTTVSQAMTAALSGKGGKFNCVGCDFSGQNLSGHSFRGQELSGADFSSSNLRNADFSNSVLVGADFSHADLRGANFANAKLSGCDFSYARIDGINFSGASLVGCSIDAHSLSPSQAASLLHGCRTGCDFSGADLSGQDLRNIDLSGVDLSNANLRGANLSGARLQGVDFSGAHLEGAHFDGTDIIGCDLSGVNLQNVDLSKARITGSKLTPTR